MSRPDIHLPVDARGELRLDAPTGRRLDIVADGDTVRVAIPGLREIVSLAPRTGRRRSVRFLANALASCDLTLSMESAGKPVFQLGRNARPNWLARLLGLAPARIPLSAVVLLFRR